MARTPDYDCTRCGKTNVGRGNLVVKQAVFLEIGRSGRRLKARVVDWLCPECKADDPDWNREAFAGTPGMTANKHHESQPDKEE